MALIPTVTKVSVTKIKGSLFTVTANLTVMDGEDEVINQDVSVKYNSGSGVNAARTYLLDAMQTVINRYKDGAQIYNSNGFDNAVSYIQSNLEV